MITGVIFDMDGVLIDSHPIHKRAWTRFLSSLGQTPTEQELEFVLDGRKREDILRHFLGELTPEQTFEYGQRKEQMFREEALDVVPVTGVLNFLNELSERNVSIAVASCGSASRVGFMLGRLGLEGRFAAVLTGDDVPLGKPDPTIFRTAADRIGSPYNTSLVVEDAVSGVIAAKNAGMKCLAIASNGRRAALKEAGADMIASDFLHVRYPALQSLFA